VARLFGRGDQVPENPFSDVVGNVKDVPSQTG
jgi:hypothetical protein